MKTSHHNIRASISQARDIRFGRIHRAAKCRKSWSELQKPMSVDGNGGLCLISETTATELVFQQEPIIKLRPSGGSGFCRPVSAADRGHALGQEQAHVLFLL
ncbi:hypothetical protein NL676_008708 [Syzygium grande]|nr:hypothetical protein NL676_008708 [Syzygium grande]